MRGKPGLACVILAGGLGTRMNSSRPKVLQGILGAPMLQYPLDAASKLRPDRLVVVTGKDPEAIRSELRAGRALSLAVQKTPKGTADALRSAVPLLRGFRGTVLVMNGDTPLVTADTLRKFLRLHRKGGNSLSVLSFTAEDPSSYGRIVRDERGAAAGIVEDRDATALEKAVKEVNSGVYAMEADALSLLPAIKRNRSKGEYYLTDLVLISARKGLATGVFNVGSEEEFLGVNTAGELLRAREMLRKRQAEAWTGKGVTFIDPGSVYIEPSVRIGKDTLIFPNVYLQGKTTVGRGCTLYPNVRVIDSTLKDGAVVKDSSLIEESTIGRDAQVGPFAHLRPGNLVGESARIGNFVELKKSVIGKGTKANHLTYIGDSRVGKGVNIGAGTITCNYDGKKKHRTVIGDGVFVGSDTQLVAPVKVGKGSYIGAGSCITRNVPPESLAICRARQRNIKGWKKRKD
jgi:bifunctional UDP-N-acetylglucosamine pyrophosphorylase/glucosamine-1-phosphate N-acetyltransferase